MNGWVWLGLGGFCLLASSGWVVSPPSGLVKVGLYFLVGLVAAVWNGRRPWVGWGVGLRVAVVGVILLAVPGTVTAGASGHVGETLQVAVFALVPMLVVMMVAQEEAGTGALLLPGLVGLGGLLLVIPFDLPGSVVGRWWLVGLVMAAVGVAGASVRGHGLLRGVAWRQAVAIVAVANGAYGLAMGDWTGSTGWDGMAVLAAVIWVAELGLLVWLLGAMRPVRLATRYLVVPLLVVVEGAVLMRPGWTLRMVAGVLLLAAGAGWVLLGREGDEAPSLSLR